MNDSELEIWLRRGQVVLVGDQLALWPPPRGAYDPCRAPTWEMCLYCPWEDCVGDPEVLPAYRQSTLF